MSSVATRRCWNDRRIACCKASLREKTTTCRGRPMSPSKSRRANTWPSEPVPPVMTTFLSPSNGLSQSAGGRLGGELGDHLLPGRRGPTGDASELGAVQAAIDRHAIVRHDVDVKAQCGAQCQQQLVLRARVAGHVP